MNTFTKVLVVLVLALSLLFTGLQIAFYQRRANLSDMLGAATANLRTQTKLADDRAAQLKDLQDKTDRTIADLRVQVTGLQSDLAGKTQDLASLQSQLTTEVASVKSLTEATKTQLASIDALNANVAQVKAERDDKAAQLTAKAKEVLDLTETVKQRNATIGDQEQQITEVKKENKKLADANDDMMAQLQDLVRRGVDITRQYGPPINAKVLDVDTALHTAVIDKGSVAGVKPNTEFTIYRDSTYVAKIVITDVDKQVAVGRVSLLAKGTEPQQGDDATTLVR